MTCSALVATAFRRWAFSSHPWKAGQPASSILESDQKYAKVHVFPNEWSGMRGCKELSELKTALVHAKSPIGLGAESILCPANDLSLSCTARAYVPKPTRHAARPHVSRAMRAACRHSVLYVD